MTENTSNFFQKNAALFVVAGLILTCIAIYAQSYAFQFINYDDPSYVYENPLVLKGLNADSIRWAFTTFHSANWHPLTWLSLLFDSSFFGTTPGVYHISSVVFHTINSILAFVVFRKYTGDLWKSAMIAFLFAVHPAHVESVAWISERKDVLSTMFWLLTMWAYFNYARKQPAATRSKKRSSGKNETARAEDRGQNYYLLTILLFACGLMAKPMLVTLPFVLLLMDFWTLDRLKTKKDFSALVVEKIPLFILSAVSSYVTVLAQSASGAVQTLEALPLKTRLLNAAVAYVKFIGMVFYPLDLGIVYPYGESLASWQIFAALIVLIGITAFCLKQINNRKYLLTGWLWFLGTLVPVIGIVQVGEQAMADRYTYVPYFGLFIMLVWGASELFTSYQLRWVSPATALIFLATLSILCFIQVSFWKKNETLYVHTIAAKPGNFLIMHNFCNSLLAENRFDEAWRQCINAVTVEPRYADTYNTLGVLGAKTGKFEESVAYFRKALELKSRDISVYNNLAFSLMQTGKIDEAVQSLNEAAELHQKAGTSPLALINSYNALAAAHARQGAYGKASEVLARALLLAPERVDIRANYALSLYYQNKLDEARREIEQAIRQNPNQAESYNTLGMILLKQGDRDEAAKQFQKASELKPDYKEAKENLKNAKGEN